MEQMLIYSNDNVNVSKGTYDGRTALIKKSLIRCKNNHEDDSLSREYKMLVFLYERGIRVPEPYSYDRNKNTLAMEFIEGRSFSVVIKDSDITLKEKLEYLLEIAVIVNEIHRWNLQHFDLKPANIIIPANMNPIVYRIDPDNPKSACSCRPVIIDFDTSLSYGYEGKNTPNYASFEQRTQKPVDKKSDVQSLAIILYEILTGELPNLSVNTKKNNWRATQAIPDEIPVNKDLRILFSKAMLADKRSRVDMIGFINKLKEGIKKLGRA